MAGLVVSSRGGKRRVDNAPQDRAEQRLPQIEINDAISVTPDSGVTVIKINNPTAINNLKFRACPEIPKF